MRCLNGHDNIDRAHFCAMCGASLPSTATEQEGPKGEHGFEPSGNSESAAPPDSDTNNPHRSPKTMAALITGAAAAVVLLGLFVGEHRSSSAGSSQATVSEKLAIDNAATAVEVDITNLQNQGGAVTSDLGGFNSNLAQEKMDLSATSQEQGVVITESKNGTDPNQVCSDSDTVQSDADNVGSDGDTVSSTADNVESDITTLRSDIATIQQDFTALESAQSLLPTYDDEAPSQSTADQAVATAQAAIQSALSTTNSDVALANSYEVQAYNDAVVAAKSGNCAPPATQFTQPTIG